MPQTMGAFIEYDPQGIPYIGLLLSSDGVSITFYLAHKANARGRVREFAAQLNKLVAEIEGMPDKPVIVKGNLDGILKQAQRGEGRTIPHAEGRPTERPRGTRP